MLSNVEMNVFRVSGVAVTSKTVVAVLSQLTDTFLSSLVHFCSLG